jgi:hypothetical protein
MGRFKVPLTLKRVKVRIKKRIWTGQCGKEMFPIKKVDKLPAQKRTPADLIWGLYKPVGLLCFFLITVEANCNFHYPEIIEEERLSREI